MHFIEGKAIKIILMLSNVVSYSLYMPCLCIRLIIHAYKYKDYYLIMTRRNRNSCQEEAFYVYSKNKIGSFILY